MHSENKNSPEKDNIQNPKLSSGKSVKKPHPQRDIFIPKTLQWLMKKTFQNLKQQHSKANTQQQKNPQANIDFEKAQGLLNSLITRNTHHSNTQQNPSLALCPKVRNLPYWNEGDSTQFDKIKSDLQENLSSIVTEYVNNSQAGAIENISNTYSGEINDNKWRRYVLAPNMSFGKFNPQAKQKFPNTVKYLQGYGKRLASAAFYAMEPGVVLPPHTDATNFFIVSHTGIQVPEHCAFEVNQEIREIHNGDTVFFDQSFTHSAWNKSENIRITLVLFLVHPDITNDELDLVVSFKDKVKKIAIVFSPIILLELLFKKVKIYF